MVVILVKVTCMWFILNRSSVHVDTALHHEYVVTQGQQLNFHTRALPDSVLYMPSNCMVDLDCKFSGGSSIGRNAVAKHQWKAVLTKH